MLNLKGYATQDRIINVITEDGVFPDMIMITPVKFEGGKMVDGGKTKKLKFTSYNTGKGLFRHELTLPKLSKKHPYQLYRLDINVNGKIESRIVGSELPLEK